MQENIMKEFTGTWLKRKIRLRDNTIKMYSRFMGELPDIDFVNMSEEEIRAIVNSTLVNFPNNVAKSAYINYIEFLFSKTKNINPIFYERMRMKKNSIISNIELPKEKNSEYKIDLEKYYIDKIKLISAIRKTDKTTRKIIILSYDGIFRINELLLNTWENIDEQGIFIPRKISKTNRDRHVKWLMPESSEIIKSIKGEGVFQKTLNFNYHKFWKALSYKKIGDSSFNPHSLRHTGITDLLWGGFDIGLVSMRAGHSSTKITAQYSSWTAPRKNRIMTLGEYCRENNINLREFYD